MKVECLRGCPCPCFCLCLCPCRRFRGRAAAAVAGSAAAGSQPSAIGSRRRRPPAACRPAPAPASAKGDTKGSLPNCPVSFESRNADDDSAGTESKVLCFELGGLGGSQAQGRGQPKQKKLCWVRVLKDVREPRLPHLTRESRPNRAYEEVRQAGATAIQFLTQRAKTCQSPASPPSPACVALRLPRHGPTALTTKELTTLTSKTRLWQEAAIRAMVLLSGQLSQQLW